MTSTRTLRPSHALIGAIASILCAHASADVTIEERMTVSGAGMMKMMNMSGRTVTAISGSNARTRSGTSRSLATSPPPMTLPARTLTTRGAAGEERKDARYAATTRLTSCARSRSCPAPSKIPNRAASTSTA